MGFSRESKPGAAASCRNRGEWKTLVVVVAKLKSASVEMLFQEHHVGPSRSGNERFGTTRMRESDGNAECVIGSLSYFFYALFNLIYCTLVTFARVCLHV